MTAILTSPERLRQIEQGYLGVADDDHEGQAAELSWLDGQITQLRERMTSQVAGLIRGGLDEQVVKAAAAQLEDELGLLDQRRAALARLVAEGESAMERVSSLDQVATSRLALMSLEERRDLLALLDVRVTAQAEGYHITGVLRELEIPAEPGPTETKVLHSHGPPARAG